MRLLRALLVGAEPALALLGKDTPPAAAAYQAELQGVCEDVDAALRARKAGVAAEGHTPPAERPPSATGSLAPLVYAGGASLCPQGGHIHVSFVGLLAPAHRRCATGAHSVVRVVEFPVPPAYSRRGHRLVAMGSRPPIADPAR